MSSGPGADKAEARLGAAVVITELFDNAVEDVKESVVRLSGVLEAENERLSDKRINVLDGKGLVDEFVEVMSGVDPEESVDSRVGVEDFEMEDKEDVDTGRLVVEEDSSGIAVDEDSAEELEDEKPDEVVTGAILKESRVLVILAVLSAVDVFENVKFLAILCQS